MRLSEVKKALHTLEQVSFQLAGGESVPKHFHVTEVGSISKNFIDCGGTVRNEEFVSFQLWIANDYDHRLAPRKLLNIIELSEKTLGLEDAEIEVEYQSKTIGKFGLDFDGTHFLLTSKQTDCLAKEACAIPPADSKVKILVDTQSSCCSPTSGCCE